MVTKLGKMVTCQEGFLLIKLQDLAITWFYISTCTTPIAAKHDKIVTQSGGLLPIKSHETLNMCSREVT